jgi:DNA polymerase I
MSTLYLIDGSSQMYRAYHAIRGLTGPDGRSTNAVFGFVAMLRKLIADHKPDFIASAFDLAGPTFRSGLLESYKANRPPMPSDLEEQIPWIHQACAALGVPVLTHEGFEADDIIGTLALRGAAAGHDVAIVTGDKDFFQLVGGRIRVFNPRDDGTWYDADGVVAKFGVTPDRVVDVLSLTGDAVDNVKGVPGIGEKGARELLARFGSLDALLDGAGTVQQKRYREALLTHAEEARASRVLVTIRTDVPIAIDLSAFKYVGPDSGACFTLFSKLGFRTFTSEFAPTSPSAATPATGTAEAAPAPATATATATGGSLTHASDYVIVSSIGGLEALVDRLRAGRQVGFRVIGDDPNPMRARIVGIVLSGRERQACYVPVGHRTLDEAANLDQAAVLSALTPLLADEDVEKIGHDVKYDAIVLARHGVAVGGPGFDTMLASYLIDSTRAPHALEDLSVSYLGYKPLTEEGVYGKGAKATAAADLPASASLAFAGERADLPLQLARVLRDTLVAEHLDEVYATLEWPLVPVLVALEQVGVRVDTAALGALSQRLDQEMQARSRRVFELAGETFNINSPKQLGEILFERMGLPVLKKTGTTRVASTSVEVLEELALTHELPRLILDWRSMQKLKGTYVDALPGLVNPKTGRVHTNFNQAVAATGRLSSSDPNLQNIPVRTELGREIRRAFVAEPGSVLISADYSQIELRVLAHLSGDEALIDAFKRGEDIHDRTALAIFGPASGLDRKEMRSRAKMVNYALLYGKTAFTLSKDIGVTQQAAQAFIDAYFAGFPAVRAFIDKTLEDGRTTGVVKTLWGRRRPVPELTSRNGQVRMAIERVAVNMPIQGTAADILKRAMIDVHAALGARPGGAGGRRARMILTVHDELLFEVPEDQAEEVAALVRIKMEGAADLAVPLTVDIGIGDNWKDAKS